MSDDVKMSPCPFDGSPADVTRVDGGGRPSSDPWRAGCTTCGSEFFDHSKVDAVAAWNRRAPSPAPAPTTDPCVYAADGLLQGFEEAREQAAQIVETKAGWLTPRLFGLGAAD